MRHGSTMSDGWMGEPVPLTKIMVANSVTEQDHERTFLREVQNSNSVGVHYNVVVIDFPSPSNGKMLGPGSKDLELAHAPFPPHHSAKCQHTNSRHCQSGCVYLFPPVGQLPKANYSPSVTTSRPKLPRIQQFGISVTGASD